LNGLVDETTPIEPTPEARDAYTITKIAQEHLVTETCTAAGMSCVILRPGAIYGPEKSWDFGRALSTSSFDFIFAPNATFALTFVDNCSDAIVKAVTAPSAAGKILNIVDDDLPTFRQFYDACRKAGAPTGHPVHVPWALLSAIGLSVRLLNKLACRNRAKLPEFLAYRRQQARWKPRTYTNTLAKAELGWVPTIGLSEGTSLMIGLSQLDHAEGKRVETRSNLG
jgi:nucleoside-diphosphate-sugar epimerase